MNAVLYYKYTDNQKWLVPMTLMRLTKLAKLNADDADEADVGVAMMRES